METRIVIVAYKPKPGKENDLKLLALEHYEILKGQDLVTDRTPILMIAKDETIIEVFEWKSRAAIERAHTNKTVLDLWEKYSQVCEYIPFGNLDESASLFADFTPLS